jgi:flagellar motor protein MotB
MRTISSYRESTSVDEENPYWMSFSDIMAGLLVIFVLAAVALILELEQKSEEWDKTIAQIARAEEVRKDILTEIERELKERDIPVEISENKTVIRIPADVLSFKSREYEIPDDPLFQMRAMEIGRVIYSAITKDDRQDYLDTIFVEGHTDRIPFNNRVIHGNWGLSTLRAISVWEFWNSDATVDIKLEDLENRSGKKLFSVSGYAATRPNESTADDDPDSAETLRKNRRIDIRFTIRRPELSEYEDIRDKLK